MGNNLWHDVMDQHLLFAIGPFNGYHSNARVTAKRCSLSQRAYTDTILTWECIIFFVLLSPKVGVLFCVCIMIRILSVTDLHTVFCAFYHNICNGIYFQTWIQKRFQWGNIAMVAGKSFYMLLWFKMLFSSLAVLLMLLPLSDICWNKEHWNKFKFPPH